MFHQFSGKQLNIAVLVLLTAILTAACAPPLGLFPTETPTAYRYPAAGAGVKVAIEAGRLRIADPEMGLIWEVDSPCAYRYPRWAPNGRLLAVTIGCGQDTDIGVYDTATDSWSPLIQEASKDYDADWSPDGTQIVFTSERDGNLELYLIDVDVTGKPFESPRRLTDNSSVDLWPAWSPDGSRIVFASDRGNLTNDLYTIDPVTGEVNLMFRNDLFYEFQPAWGRDAATGRQYVAFTAEEASDPGGVWQVYSFEVNAQGTMLSESATNRSEGVHSSSPAWSPDGNILAFYREEKEPGSVYLLDFATDPPKLVYFGPGALTDWWAPSP